MALERGLRRCLGPEFMTPIVLGIPELTTGNMICYASGLDAFLCTFATKETCGLEYMMHFAPHSLHTACRVADQADQCLISAAGMQNCYQMDANL